MLSQLTFRQRVGYLWTCVAPAHVLCEEHDDGEESLQSDASALGLTYVQVIQSFGDGTYVARVAPTPDALTRRAYTVLFTEEQLRYALPWDCRLQSSSPERVLRMLMAHAAAIAPLTRLELPANDQGEGAEDAQPAAQASVEPAHKHEDVDLEPLPTIFVSHETVLASFRILDITCKRERRVHSVILHAVVETLAHQLERCSWQERRELKQHYDQVQQVRRWRRLRYNKGHGWQRVVALEPFAEHGTVGWNVVVGVPRAA